MNSVANDVVSSTVCLYVGNVDSSVSEKDLKVKFKEFGEIEKISIRHESCANHVYFYHKKFADAEKMLKYFKTHLMKVNGKALSIQWAVSDIPIETENSGLIFIRNLAKSVTNNDLHNIFANFGQISLCKVIRDEQMASTGVGFVNFETKQSAREAQFKINGKLIGTKQILVDICDRVKTEDDELDDNSSLDDENDENDEDFSNIYVKNFGKDMDDEKLKDLFSKFGEITSLTVALNDEGESMGYGYVAFSSVTAAKTAVAVMNGKKINKHELYVSRFQSKSERERLLKEARWERSKGRNLFVKNLSESIDDYTLNCLFSKYGDIVSAKIMRDDEGKSKCHGFVCFDTEEEAQEAKNAMNGKTICSKKLYVGDAQRKEERKKIVKKNRLKSV